MTVARIPFCAPYQSDLELKYVEEALATRIWHGDGVFTRRATEALLDVVQAPHAMLTTSCTHALELASILLDIGPGDEVIVPSFSFPSTAACVAIRGAVPVFVDIDPATMNIDPEAVRAAVTNSTTAIHVVHYAGVACDMEAIGQIASEHGLTVVEDNAHGFGARWRGRPLGTLGTFATQSWHDTKNVACGEGGALVINDESFVERAEIVREKGTDRSKFLRGQVDKYTWIDHGSSYLPSEILAAVLLAQLERFDVIQARRHSIWNTYAAQLADWAGRNGVELMHVPPECEHPAHMFYVFMPSHEDQEALLTHLRSRDVVGTFHYLPLDASPAGRKFGRTPTPCSVTADRSNRLVRLPLFPGLSDDDVTRVLEAVSGFRVA